MNDNTPRGRGSTHATLDEMENVPFASVGGLDTRSDLTTDKSVTMVPDYIAEEDAAAFLSGYIDRCKEMYGEDWQTCTFHWVPVMEIIPSKPSS